MLRPRPSCYGVAISQCISTYLTVTSYLMPTSVIAQFTSFQCDRSYCIQRVSSMCCQFSIDDMYIFRIFQERILG